MYSIRHLIPAAALALTVAAGGAAIARPHGGPIVRHHHPRAYVHVHGGYPFYGWYSGWSYPGPYAYPYPPAPPDYAIVDTDISPEEAIVYLDGERMGEADDFDGLPEYLTVPPGRHVLEFRRKGFQTLRINIDARRGAYYSIDRELHEGRADKAPRHEDWGGGPARRHHEMRQAPPRHDDRNPGDPDDGRKGDGAKRSDDQPDPDDQPGADDPPSTDDEPGADDDPGADEPGPDDEPIPD